MTIWIAAILLTVACLALVLRPLLFGKASPNARIGYDLAVFKDQLAEVDRDVAGNLLSADQAEAARTEIRRRMLAAAAHDEAEAKTEKARHRSVRLAAAVVVVLPLGAFGLYSVLGNPTLPDKPYKDVQAARMGLDHDSAANVLQMVDSLSAKLEKNPNDASGWAMLGKSYRALGRLDDAAAALQKAGALDPRNVDVWGTLGETIVAQAQGMVMPEARQAFLSALKVDPRDPRSRFYLGLARMQIGDGRGAVAVWRDLADDSAPDAPWMPVLNRHVQQVAAEAGFDPATVEPRSELDLIGTALPGQASGAPPAPAQPQTPVGGQAAATTSHPGAEGAGPEATAEFVRQRVADLAERLKTNPDDADGWAMLGRSYKVMGEFAKAKDALGRAAKLNKTDLDLQMAYAEAVLNAAPQSGDKLPAEFVAVMRDILKLAPTHSDALYYVGLAEVEAGRKAEGKAHWTRLLTTLDPTSPEYGELKGEIDKLGAD